MAQMQKVRFTGKRTGATHQLIPGVGIVTPKQEVWVTPDTAERYVTEHPIADGEMAADFVLVGKAVDLDDDELAKKLAEQGARAGAIAAELNAGGTPPAHAEDPRGLTAEQEADLIEEARASGQPVQEVMSSVDNDETAEVADNATEEGK